MVIEGSDPGPVMSARAVGLRYVRDGEPGLSRRRRGRGFSYRGIGGAALRDRDALARIRALAIPPAWRDVWICPHPDGHVQATGRDAKGRKQYRYHPRWRDVRDDVKYGRMLAFGAALPIVRATTAANLRLSGLPRERVLAAIVQLLEKTFIRVGNEEYARANRSFGLTTLRDRHVEVNGSSLVFEFRAKSGVPQVVDLRDPRLARTVKRCQELPGQTLFQYIDVDGAPQRVDSGDVNDYLRQVTGQDFTAKDFRTWAGTVLAACALRDAKPYTSEAQAKRCMAEAIEQVARRLGNTTAVCRKSYVHPVVLDAYLDGTTIDLIARRAGRLIRRFRGLSRDEVAVLALLQARGPGARTARLARRRRSIRGRRAA